MQARTWSTDAIRPSLRLDYWVGAICEAFLEMDCDSRSRDSFEGRLARVAVGELAFHQVRAQTQDVFRTRRAIARSSHDPWYLIAQRSHAWHVRQDGRLLQLRAGDVALVDASRCYELHFPEAFEVMSIQLPRPFVLRWLADAESEGARFIARDAGWGAPLSALCLQLAQDPQAATHYPAELLSDHLGALLAAVLEPRAAQACDAGLAARATHWLRERIGHAGVVAADAARDLDVSVRSLHRAFAAQQASFAGTLRRLRLEQARHLLSQARLASLTTAEIGRRCGFADASHFTREFRSATGCTPAAWRRRAGTPVPSRCPS